MYCGNFGELLTAMRGKAPTIEDGGDCWYIAALMGSVSEMALGCDVGRGRGKEVDDTWKNQLQRVDTDGESLNMRLSSTIVVVDILGLL
ncbi:hypothetical protein ACSBR2_035442 [Camellia fascicularis]